MLQIVLIAAVLFLNKALLNLADTTLFSFSSFNNESCSLNSQLICSGSVTASDGFISLTQPKRKKQIGKLLYRQPSSSWDLSVSISFTFRIIADRNSSGSGDGMAFIMASDVTPLPKHSTGSYIGLMNNSTKDDYNLHQVAIEFDTYKNEFDIDDNHIAIVTTSIENPVIAKSLNSIGVDLKSGKEIKVQIGYDTYGNSLSVSVAYSSKPTVEFLYVPLNMEETVSSSIYVGFTASTGRLTESHQILSWEFSEPGVD